MGDLPISNDPFHVSGNDGDPIPAMTTTEIHSTSSATALSIDIKGLNWPGQSTQGEPRTEGRQQIQKLEGAMRTILECIGDDPDREGLRDTPARYARAMLFFTKGYKERPEALINGAIFQENCGEMVIVKDIDLFSLCEHHLVPFIGKVHIGYIPNGRVIGLSKLARLAEVFARRLQIQERLTQQIARCIQNVLDPRGVAVVMESSHLCMAMHGVQKVGSTTTTSCMLGCMRSDSRYRDNFLTFLYPK